jgi:hypothetical protein
LVFFLSN